MAGLERGELAQKVGIARPFDPYTWCHSRRLAWPFRCLTNPEAEDTDKDLHSSDRTPFMAEVIRRRGPWRNFEAAQYAILERVDWFNNRRLLQPIGNNRHQEPTPTPKPFWKMNP